MTPPPKRLRASRATWSTKRRRRTAPPWQPKPRRRSRQGKEEPIRSATLLALVACRPNLEEACHDYLTALEACLSTAYRDQPDVLEATLAGAEGTCDPYLGSRGHDARKAAKVLTCEADLLATGDCETPEAYLATVAGLSGCDPGS